LDVMYPPINPMPSVDIYLMYEEITKFKVFYKFYTIRIFNK